MRSRCQKASIRFWVFSKFGKKENIDNDLQEFSQLNKKNDNKLYRQMIFQQKAI